MKVRNWLLGLIRVLANIAGINDLQQQVIESKMLSAVLLINSIKSLGIIQKLEDAEFKVFSQFGDDGIIQYLIHNLDIPAERKIFIEFGVQDYKESNTRFLLKNNNWKGLVIDGSTCNINKIISDSEYWRHDLTAASAFIDKDNVNDLFVNNGFVGEIGLLSIDIDGNDYWVWDAIKVIDPIIIICEYNSIFGSQYAVTVPYCQKFQRNNAHYSNLYWGASLKALCLQAESKNYSFIGCNSAGNNAYFVRNDKIGSITSKTCADGFVQSKFRESRDKNGRLTFLDYSKGLFEIKEKKVFDLEREVEVKISDIFELV